MCRVRAGDFVMACDASGTKGGRSNIHGGDIPDTRESEVIADKRELILHRHVENSPACLGSHPGIADIISARGAGIRVGYSQWLSLSVPCWARS